MNDALSNLLTTISVSSARWTVLQLCEAAGVAFRSIKNSLTFCTIVDGAAFLNIGGSIGREAAVRLSPSDMLLSMGGATTTIFESTDDQGAVEIFPKGAREDELSWLKIGSGEQRALLIVGQFDVDPLRWAPIRRAVPDVIYLCRQWGELPPWAGSLRSVRSLKQTLTGEGGAAFSCKLAELLAIQIIRSHDLCSPVGDSKFGPPKISEAIRLLNTSPAVDWTVQDLASAVGMSRSVFSDAFFQAVGEAPIRYLTRIRMKNAAELLKNQGISLIEIAHQVGYSSDISLIRTFKRYYGVTPTECRIQEQDLPSTDKAWLPLSHPAFVFEESIPDAFKR